MIRHSILPVFAALVLSGCASQAIYDENDLHFILPCESDTSACMVKMEQACAQAKGRVMSRNIVNEEVPVVQVICRPPPQKKPQAE